jgi:hypothetical protein
MGQLRSIWPECPPFPTSAAEELAAKYDEDPSKYRGGLGCRRQLSTRY